MNIENYISSGIIEQYVLGLCNDAEKAELISLRKQHAEVNTAIINFEKALEAQLMATSATTSTKTDDIIINVFKLLNTSETKFSAAVETKPAVVRSFSFAKYAAAASVALLIASGAYNYFQYNKTQEQAERIAAIEKNNSATLPAGDYKIITDPNITPVAMYGVPAHAICKCTLYWDKNTDKAYVMIHHLVAPEDGKAYQIFATVNGKQINLGTIDDKIRGRFVEVKDVPFEATAFTVSQEANGNAASQPTAENIWLQGKI